MLFMPKEHGAYGQFILPVVTALSVAGLSTPGLFLTVSAVAAFVAHEPVSILVGLRGPRAKRDFRTPAIRWLVAAAGIACVAGVTSLFTMERDAQWSLAVPIVPAVVLGIATIRGREKSWYGELAVACAFAGLGVPLAMAGGAPISVAAAVALPFALLFVASTLAVRIVILRARGGGDPRATAATRTGVYAVMAGGGACLGWLAAIELVPTGALVATAPGLLTAFAIAARPPQPTQLRMIGWTLVGVSVLTAAIVITTL